MGVVLCTWEGSSEIDFDKAADAIRNASPSWRSLIAVRPERTPSLWSSICGRDRVGSLLGHLRSDIRLALHRYNIQSELSLASLSFADRLSIATAQVILSSDPIALDCTGLDPSGMTRIASFLEEFRKDHLTFWVASNSAKTHNIIELTDFSQELQLQSDHDG